MVWLPQKKAKDWTGLDFKTLVGVVVDSESMVEVHESEEGLNVLHFLRFWPIRDGLNFLHGHGESIRRETETEVLDGGGMKLTFLWFGVMDQFSLSLSLLSNLQLDYILSYHT